MKSSFRKQWPQFLLLMLSLPSCTALAAIADCPANAALDQSFATGTRWELCWATDPKKGLVLTQLSYTPRNGTRFEVLQSAMLAQVHRAYDDAGASEHFLSDAGLPLRQLAAGDCPGGTVLNDANGTPVLCRFVAPRGYAWRGSGQVQGSSLVLYGISGAGNNTYIQQWTLDDDGTIHPQLGVGGALDPNRLSGSSNGWALGPGESRYATNRYHTAYWRLDFALGGQADDQVQQLDYSTGEVRTQTITTITNEGQFEIAPEAQRFWLVRDRNITNQNGHNISYQIVLQNSALFRGVTNFSNADFYVTQSRDCEQFASRNRQANCAADLPGFINGEALSDPVVWAGTTWHQVPRAEDEANTPIHWQGIILAPRDFNGTSPLL